MNKIALISGASKGIGKAIAIKLASTNHDIIINYLTSQKEAIELKDYIINTYKVRCIVSKFDVSNENNVNKEIDRIEKEFGYIDILVNNAGIDLSNMFYLKTSNDFRKTMDVNVIGAFNLFKRLYKHMIDNKYGKVVNISSTNGINTYYPMSIDYDASKAALISLTHNMALQGSPYINVNCVAPGLIGTNSELECYDESFLKEEKEKILVNRIGDANDVANLVNFLVSDESSYINNSIIRIDGGLYGA